MGDLRTRQTLQAALAELVGTFSLALAALLAPTPSTALAVGLTLAAFVYALGDISGCNVNPAVTLGLVVTRRLPPVVGVLYDTSPRRLPAPLLPVCSPPTSPRSRATRRQARPASSSASASWCSPCSRSRPRSCPRAGAGSPSARPCSPACSPRAACSTPPSRWRWAWAARRRSGAPSPARSSSAPSPCSTSPPATRHPPRPLTRSPQTRAAPAWRGRGVRLPSPGRRAVPAWAAPVRSRHGIRRHMRYLCPHPQFRAAVAGVLATTPTPQPPLPTSPVWPRAPRGGRQERDHRPHGATGIRRLVAALALVLTLLCHPPVGRPPTDTA